MSKKYKVLVLKLSGLSNKIFDAGEEVGEECFPSENIAKLVEQGFLGEVKTEEKPKEEKSKK